MNGDNHAPWQGGAQTLLPGAAEVGVFAQLGWSCWPTLKTLAHDRAAGRKYKLHWATRECIIYASFFSTINYT